MAHILVIDDDEQFRGMLVQMLSKDRHRVDFAVDGEQGLRFLQQNKPDLIITDILMPYKDGIDLIRTLVLSGNPIPVIAISGGRRFITAEFNLESAELIGVKAALAKPFGWAELRSAVAKALA